jgi:phosphonate transport system permease protein
LLPPSTDQPTYIWKVFAQQIATVGSKHLSSDFKNIVERMIETIFIGMMATFFGVIFALPVSFFAARNLMSASPITLVFYYLVRAVLNIIRSIEPLIWAIIAVIVVGLGPFAGILALSLHSIAALGKLYSEAIESISTGPIEAIQATGATWVQTVMFAVIPQIVPPFVSFTIYRWDVNIRMSTIIGFVGGGGIGFLLAQYIPAVGNGVGKRIKNSPVTILNKGASRPTSGLSIKISQRILILHEAGPQITSIPK